MKKIKSGAGGTILFGRLIVRLFRRNVAKPRRRDGARRPGRADRSGKTLFISYGCGWCHQDGGRKAGRCPQLMGTEHDDNFILSRIAAGSPGKMRRSAKDCLRKTCKPCSFIGGESMTLRQCRFGFLMRIVAVTILTAATASFALARPLELDQGARQIACLR